MISRSKVDNDPLETTPYSDINSRFCVKFQDPNSANLWNITAKIDHSRKERKRNPKTRQNKLKLNHKHFNFFQKLSNAYNSKNYLEVTSNSILPLPPPSENIESVGSKFNSSIPKVSINNGTMSNLISKKKILSWRIRQDSETETPKIRNRFGSYMLMNIPRETVNNFVRIFIENLECRPVNNYQPGYYKEDFLHVDSSDIEKDSVLKDLRFIVETKTLKDKDIKKLQKFIMFVLYNIVEFRLDNLSGKKSTPNFTWLYRVFSQKERKTERRNSLISVSNQNQMIGTEIYF